MGTGDAGGTGVRVGERPHQNRGYAARIPRFLAAVNSYPQGTVVTDEQMAQINLKPHKFHGDWNYTIRPRKK